MNVSDRRRWAQTAPSTQRHEIRNCVNVCVKVNWDCNKFNVCVPYVPSCNSVLTHLAWCVSLWFISVWVVAAISSKAWASQARKNSQPSYRWDAAKRPIPHGGWKDSVCFEKRARMDSFAAVLPMPSYSSIYEAKCDLMSCVNELRYNSWVCMHMINLFFFYPQVKNKPCIPLGICIYSWIQHRCEQ